MRKNFNNRHSGQTEKDISYSFWLAFDDLGAVTLTRAKPNLGRSERGMQLTVTLPKALFQTPELSASIKVDSPVGTPLKIDATAAAEALSKSLGMPVDLVVVNAGENHG